MSLANYLGAGAGVLLTLVGIALTLLNTFLIPRIPHFPDHDSFVLACTSRKALKDMTEVVSEFGPIPKNQNFGSVDRVFFDTGLILNYTHPDAFEETYDTLPPAFKHKPQAADGLIADNPSAAARTAIEMLQARGYSKARQISIKDPGTNADAIAFVDTNGALEPGNILVFRKEGPKMKKGGGFMERYRAADPRWNE